jgi:hypothetical protein
MTHYWVFVVGMVLVSVGGGYVMGVVRPTRLRVQVAIASFLVGAVLVLTYMLLWVVGAVH